MSKLNNLLGFLIRSIVAGLAIAFVIVYLWPALIDRDEPSSEPAQPPTPDSYAEAVSRAAPSVVSIRTVFLSSGGLSKSGESRANLGALYQIRQDAGSGVIMSEDGYILTNHHVINQARTIHITLWDGRSIPAKVVGSDPATDVAVLKIDLDGLPVAPLFEGVVRVGDVVLAIGNALRLSHTVTMGIVSATGRNDLRSQQFEDFIQTDAAINRGNSGGALVNAQGELIGISARNTKLELAQNIGFAIPIGLATNVMEQIVVYGSVRRGWLGAIINDQRPTAIDDGSYKRQGISVDSVMRDGPAWKAGLRQGDVITALDGEPVSDASQFLLAISQRVPGSEVELDVARRAEVFQTYATLIQQPPL